MPKKYFSFSEYNKYLFNRSEYIDVYINGKQQEENNAMKLGSIIHSALENCKYDWLKALKENNLEEKNRIVRKLLDKMENKRPPESEVTMIAEHNGTKLLSIFDGFDKKNRELVEFKTADKERWNTGIVNAHEQLSFYAWVYYLNTHSFFKEIRLYFLNTSKGNVKTFKTVRSMRDIKDIREKVNKVIWELKNRGLWDKRLSRKERQQKTLF